MLKNYVRYIRYFNWLDFALILIIAHLGLLCVFSATYTITQPYSFFFKKQALGILSGSLFYLIFSCIDHRRLYKWGHDLFIIVIGLLAFTLIKGAIGMGAQRWLDLVFFRFQPAELAKLFLPAFIAYYLSLMGEARHTIQHFLPILLILIISAFLILKQPDLGTALLVIGTGLLVMWGAGLERKWFIIGSFVCFCALPILWYCLKPYQKNRIAVFFGGGQANKERYQTEQALIAIGSGGLTGKGFLQGTQNKFMFLPEGRTDFIFAVACEEWGFIGALSILLLYALLFWRFLRKIFMCSYFFSQLIAFGLLAHIILASITNIGMVLGLLPIVGIPLPLFSYGISNLWVTFASLGWINSIHIHQYYLGD